MSLCDCRDDDDAADVRPSSLSSLMGKCGVRGLALSLNVKQSKGHAIPIAFWIGTVPIANAS